MGGTKNAPVTMPVTPRVKRWAMTRTRSQLRTRAYLRCASSQLGCHAQV